MPIQTFADSFRIQQQSAPTIMGGYGALSVTGQGNHISPGSQIFRPIEQVQHYQLWNYVAISRNSWAACKSIPNVSSVKRTKPGALPQQAQAYRYLSKPQRQFLREYYSGVLRGPQDDLEPLDDSHPLVTLLNSPNTDDWWNSFAFETYMFWQLTGGFYWWVIPNGFGMPSELYVIPTQWVTKIYSKAGDLQYYQINGNGRQMDLPPEQVIESIAKNPVDKTRPISPISAGAPWTINSERIEQARQLSLEQGPYPSVVLGFDPEIYNEAPDEQLLTRVGEKFISRYGGSPNAGKPIAMPPGITATPWSLKPAEMDFQATAPDVRDNVLALHGTPLAIAGLSHDLNRASIQGAHLIHCETVIMPLHCWVAGVVTRKLAPRYGDNLFVWFDDVRPRDDEQELAETTLDWQMGAISPDERRQDRGRPKLGTPAAEKTFVAIGYSPLEDFDADTEERAESAADASGVNEPGDATADTGSGGGKDPESPASAKPAKTAAKSDKSQHVGGCPVHDHGRGNGGVLPVDQRAKTHGRMEGIARGYVQIHQVYERAATANLKRMWSVVQTHVLDLLDKHSTDRSAPSAAELVSKAYFRPVFNRAMTPVWQAACKAGIKFEQQTLGLNQKQQAASNEVELPAVMQKAVADYLKDRQDGVWSLVLDTTQKELQGALDESLQSGESPAERRKRVQSVLGERKDNADAIARTESTSALSYGQQKLREAEHIDKKVWIDTIDKKTRGTHIVAGGQVVPNKQPFTVGGQKMMHPGDGSLGAGPEEIVNCRCCATGYIE